MTRVKPSSSATIRLGYIPLLDAAPLLIAHELGFFKERGLRVKISREAGWATIRDKIVFGEIDGAHALSSLLVVTNCGLGCVAAPTICPFIFNAHGSAITLSEGLWQKGVRDVVSLKKFITEETHRRLTFGVVFPFSVHAYLLRKWLQAGGINPDQDVRIVIVPPPQMHSNLRGGNLDGYCVGEPWNSLAVQTGVGWCAAIGAELDPGHPDKVFLVRQSFQKQYPAELLAIVAALHQAALYCDAPANRSALVKLLSSPRYLNIPARYLLNSLAGNFDAGHGRHFVTKDFILFSRGRTNEPTAAKAHLILEEVLHCGALHPDTSLPNTLIPQIFRNDLYQASCPPTSTQQKPTHEKKPARRHPVLA
jgi:ABC-type nitrate/sulfonate/bicarbonate transport system substrate-binding protein